MESNDSSHICLLLHQGKGQVRLFIQQDYAYFSISDQLLRNFYQNPDAVAVGLIADLDPHICVDVGLKILSDALINSSTAFLLYSRLYFFLCRLCYTVFKMPFPSSLHVPLSPILHNLQNAFPFRYTLF